LRSPTGRGSQKSSIKLRKKKEGGREGGGEKADVRSKKNFLFVISKRFSREKMHCLIVDGASGHIEKPGTATGGDWREQGTYIPRAALKKKKTGKIGSVSQGTYIRINVVEEIRVGRLGVAGQ